MQMGKGQASITNEDSMIQSDTDPPKAPVDAESDQSHPLHLGQVLKGGKSNTHQGKEKEISKPNCKTQNTQQDYSHTDIYNFRTDECLMLDDVMDVGNAEPDKAGGSGIQNTGQKLLAKLKDWHFVLPVGGIVMHESL